MTRKHGRCAKGQCLIAKVPHGRRETLTFIAALRCDGLTAPCLLDDDPIAMRTASSPGPSSSWADLAARRYRGDGQPQHRRSGARWQGGCQAVLPAQIQPGPDPIEQAFAKLKTLLRKANARSVEVVEAALPRC